MGVTYGARTVLGCVYTYQDLHKESRFRVCSYGGGHPTPLQEDTFCTLEINNIDYDKLNFHACPYCKSSLYQEAILPIYEGSIGSGYFSTNESWNIQVVPAVPNDSKCEGCAWFVGYDLGLLTDDISFKKISLDDMISKKEVIKSVLEKHGLWDEDDFGIYTYLYVS